MKKWIFALAAISSCPVTAADQTAIIEGSGQKIIIRDDKTWAPLNEDALPQGQSTEENKLPDPKTPAAAVQIYDVSLTTDEINYRQAVTLKIHYRSTSPKQIVAVSVKTTVSNTYGKAAISTVLNDEVIVDPGELSSSSGYWHWDDNPFIKNEPYDLLWQAVDNGTAKVRTEVIKVIFSDGASVTAPSSKPQKAKKK